MVTYLTSNGNDLMNQVIGAESVLNFTKIQFGNGTSWSTEDNAALRREISEATALYNVIKEIEFDNEEGTVEVDSETGLALLQASFSNIGDDYDWHATEVGIWAQDGEDTSTEILYSVSAMDVSKAAWVPTQSENAATFEFSIYVYVGDIADVTAALSVNADKASKADLDDHIHNMNNPHGVSKYQVGLGNVPNVTTNDQRPYYTASSELAELDGGSQTNPDTNEPEGKETLATILGKLKTAVKAFIDHRSDNTNPHKVTAAQVNAAAVKHYHNASVDFNDGILPIERGGTGTDRGVGFTGASYNCWGYAYLKGGMLMQWGRVKVEDRDVYVTFDKPFANANYVLTFDTSGNDFIPVWKKPSKEANGFTMNRTFGVNSSFNNWLQSLFGIRLFGGSAQVADWIAIGQAK